MQDPAHEWPRRDNSRPAHNPSEGVRRLSDAPNWTDGVAGMPGISPRLSRPLCSRCYGEPRYPGQRWGPRCFARYHAERRARRRRERTTGSVRDEATTYISRKGYNTPPPLFEQLKRLVIEIPKYRNRPESLRISLLPIRGMHTSMCVPT